MNVFPENNVMTSAISTIAKDMKPNSEKQPSALKFEDVLSGPAYLPGEMFQTDICAVCGLKKQLSRSIYDVKGERHYICDDCTHAYLKWKGESES